MKKFRSIFLSLILALALVVGLVACGNEGGGNPKTHTFSFDMGGHGTQITAQTLASDEVTVKPEDPTASGWKFDGWYVDSSYSELFTFGTTISEDTTVYAKWSESYTVRFETGVEDCVIASQNIASSGTVKLPNAETMVSAGKKFEGWYLDSGFAAEFDATTPITMDVTLHAKWSDYFKVTFDRNGRGAANRVPQAQEYFAKNSKVEKPEDMSQNSYKFLGWSTDVDGKNNLWDFENDVLTDSITLYAQWARVYRVVFDLNNEEALQLPPDEQSIEEGMLAVKPELDPVVTGYVFKGWYTQAEGGEVFDFNTITITETTTIYAQWEESDSKVGSLDVVLPEYSYREEAPYGERPDLDGHIIDGKMGAEEKWEEQNWYSTSITEAPTATLRLTTKFSEKGLYVFLQVEDNGGLFMMGKNWYDRNSNLLFHIYDGVVTNTFRIDTLSLYPTYLKTKIAINIAEGEVNTANAADKRAVWNVEMFTTWKDLGFESSLSTVKIRASYNYKRIASDNIKFYLTTPFSNGAAMTAADYIDYDAKGYTKADAPNATLGVSSLGIAKTPGWDVAHESDENNAYVSSNGATTQAIFYKGIVDTEYYEMEFEIDGSKYLTAGKAGATIYSSANNYAMLVFAVGADTYDKVAGKFIKAKPYMKVTDKDGKLWTKILDEVDVSATGKIEVKVIFSNGYIYCILNGVLIHCEFVADLNVRTNPGLCTTEGGQGIRFINYSAKVLTAQEAVEETGKYAYILSTGRLRNLTITLSTTGVSSEEGVSKKVVMGLQGSQVALSASQKEKILTTGEIDSRISVNQIESLIFTVGNEQHDIIDALTDPVTGAKWGEFEYEYPFKGDAVITNTVELVPTENLTAIIGTIVDNNNGKAIAATATITSNNPRLSKYEMAITGGQIVLVVPKGYDYKITLHQTAYRETVLDVLENVTEIINLPEVRLVPNVLGGTAQSKKTGFSIGSSIAGWDMSEESKGKIIFETTGANPPAVFFSGYTVHEYQYAKVSVTNITDVTAYTNYEKDPAIGFQFYTPQKRAFLGLRQTGLRYLHDQSYWGPVQIGGYGKSTCDVIDITEEHKDTLEILRIKTSLYSWINGFYMGCIEMDGEFAGECAIAVLGTFSYYGKIIYRDYEIQVGDAAVAIAKERVGITLDYDESAYAYTEDGSDIDFEKPLVAVEGLTEIIKEDLSREYVALAGTTVSVVLTEHAAANKILEVSLGSYGSVVLSAENPSAEVVIPGTAKGVAKVNVSSKPAAKVTGKFVGENDSIVGPFTGYVLLENGSKLAFTTGEDGTFTVSVPISSTFTVKLNQEGFVAPGITSRTPTSASATKDIGEMIVYTSQLGGKVKGTQYASSSSDYYEVSYDNDPNTIYEGEYAEAKPTSANFNIAINSGTFRDFDISFSMVRYQSTESDPGFGLQLHGADSTDQLLFWKTGVRCMNSVAGWGGRTEKVGVMNWSTEASGFGKAVDLRVVRRGNVALMYYKLHGEAEWNLIHVQEILASGSVAVLIQSTNTYDNHYIIWNLKAEALDSENIPAELEASVSAKFAEGSEEGGTITISGGTESADGMKFYYGDTATVNIKTNPGYLVAWAKVNGEFVTVAGNKITVAVSDPQIEVEVLLETVFLTYDVTGKIAVDKTYKDFALPKTVNVVAYMEDGRSYPSYGVTVDADGKFNISLREGTFKVYAYSTTLSSKAIDATISEDNKDLGTITLSVMRAGNVTVNGVTLTNTTTMGEVFDKGMLTLPGTTQKTHWIAESAISGDFVFSTTLTQTGGADSECFTNDHVAGVVFGNGTATFGIQFWAKGFRISAGGWSETAMIWPQPASAQYFIDNLAPGESRSHVLAVKRVGASLAVYVDGTHLFTLSTEDEDGFEWAAGVTTKVENYPARYPAVKELFASVFGDTSAEIAIGVKASLYNESGAYVNKTGFSDMVITNNADIVNSFNGTIAK